MKSAWIDQSPYFAVMGLIGGVALLSAAGQADLSNSLAALALLVLFAAISVSAVRYGLEPTEDRTPTVTNQEHGEAQPARPSPIRRLLGPLARRGKK